MRIVFLYAAEGQASLGSNPEWNEKIPPSNGLAVGFPDEGYCEYLCELVRQPGPVTEVLIVVESTRGCGSAEIEPGVNIVVMPTIDYLTPMLRPDDVIFCRHGFRTWFPFLEKQHEAGRWMLMYGANGGRERWRVWDVIFNDLISETHMDSWGRLNFDFKKPVNAKVFYPSDVPKKYDYMIGASHIHDKKGQYRGVFALSRYADQKRLYPPTILPGRAFKGEYSNQIPDLINRYALNIERPGMISRHELAERMRETKTFLHFGSGQGDRSVIEAGACGCQIVIAQPKYHNPDVVRASQVVDPDNFTIEQIEHLELGFNALYFMIKFSAGTVAQSHYPLYEFIANNKPADIKDFING